MTSYKPLMMLIAGLFLFSGSILAASATTQDSPSQDASPEVRRWLGPDGEWLPFETDEEVLDFLSTAEVVREKKLSDGINRPLKLTLEKAGVRANAIFRTVDIERIDRANASAHDRLFRDSYRFEIAAYEMSRLLGLGNIPPVVLRTFGNREGSLQLWIERAMPESKRMARGERPADPAGWSRQRQMMAIFDNLIYNFDRNPGNMLFDAAGKLWLVDHTRSFKRLPALVDAEKVRICDQDLWRHLRQLDPEEVRARLAPVLEPVDIEAVLKRRALLIDRLSSRIAEMGDQAVLIGP